MKKYPIFCDINFEGTILFIFYLWRFESYGKWRSMVTFFIIPIYIEF